MKRRFPCLSILILLLGGALCLTALAAGYLAFSLPERAAEAFGPPAPGTGRFQLIYLSARLLLAQDDLTRPVQPGGPPQPFQVQLGEPTASIASRLQRQGLIPDAQTFSQYLVYAGLDTTLQAGDYLLSPGQTPLQIAQSLQDATPTEVTFNLLPGWRIDEIAAALPTSGLTFTPQEFQAAALSPQGFPEGTAILESLPGHASLEGFLFPDAYRLQRDLDARGFIATLLENFQVKVGADLQEGFQHQGLSLYEAVTLASIVEREAVDNSEMTLIASVFYNRLNAGWKLDSDPTVQYALGYNPDQNTWWTNPLSLADLEFDSPYNTYKVPGLPPGPIANPSLEALRAVAFPAQTPYYYFRAACDGSGRHLFAETFEEHLENACP